MGSPELKICESSGRWMDYVGSPELKIFENHKAFIQLCFGAISEFLVVIDWKMCQ